jgi:hypothetical protein
MKYEANMKKLYYDMCTYLTCGVHDVHNTCFPIYLYLLPVTVLCITALATLYYNQQRTKVYTNGRVVLNPGE